jgi:hypothetical protein
MYGEPRSPSNGVFVMTGGRPVRVQTAFDFASMMVAAGSTHENMSAPERAAYNASLEALRMYFTGEMDYGDMSAFKSNPHAEVLAEQAQKSIAEAILDGIRQGNVTEAAEPEASGPTEPPAPAGV